MSLRLVSIEAAACAAIALVATGGDALADTASMPATTRAPTTTAPDNAPQGASSGASVDKRTRAESPQPALVGDALVGRTARRHDVVGVPAPDARVSALPSAGRFSDPQVALGAYLARIGDCVACHTAKNGVPFAGGLAIGSPLGTIYSTNITPDKRTGIGDWKFDDFARLMRHGETKAGYVVYPAMPYPSYSRMTEEDLRALYAYLMEAVPAAHQPNRENGISWPLSMRWPLKAWRAMFAPNPEPAKAARGASVKLARGAYIVEGLGHCGACHTPRAITLQEKALTDREGNAFLSGGGAIDGWIAPSLRNEHADGLGSWSEQEIVEFLRTGRTERTASFGAMNDVIVDSMQYLTDEDLKSIAAYLKSLKPAKTNVLPFAYDSKTGIALYHGRADSDGARIYLDRCAACHRSNGTGYGKAFPALAGNAVLQTKNPTSAIHIVLSGSAQPGTAVAPSSLTMAPYEKLLSDQEVARVVTFIQTSWGNQGGPASAAQVAELRKTAGAVEMEGYAAPMQRELRRADPGHSADASASGAGAGE